MKNFFTVLGAVLGIAGILAVALLVSNVSAQTPQPGIPPMVTLTPIPQVQNTVVPPAQPGWGMSTRGAAGGGMMGGGMMGGRMGKQGGMAGGMQMNAGPGMMHGQVSITVGGGTSMNQPNMMTGVTPMHDDVAYYLGMTSQDLHNQMANGKSMVQIAAEKGITEQQLMDSIMQGRQTAYAQAIQGGYMTQAQVDTMLQEMNNNLQMWVNDQGSQSAGWGMMWGE